MTIRCPECATVYRVPPRSTPGPRATFRCGSCDHVFESDVGAAAPDPLDDDAPDSPHAEPPDADDPHDPGDRTAPADAEPPPRRRSSAARFALRMVVAAVLTFALLSVYLFMHRGRVSQFLAQLPVVGPDLAATRLDPSDVQLTDVRGEYARAQGDALVFVITGRAVNNAPVPVSGIEIQGSVVGAGEQRRTVFAGTAPHRVQELSEREIDLLQTLEPPQDWRLLPGDEGDFLLAFVDPPLALREFAVEVASVRRRRPAATE